MRVIRIIEIEGPEEWVRKTLAHSVSGTMKISGTDCLVRELLREEIVDKLKPDFLGANNASNHETNS